MIIQDLLGGLLLGLLIACPIGPVSLTCVRNAALGGPISGLLTGAGAALAHGLFALSASFAAIAVSAFLIQWQPVLTLFSALVLIWIGLRRLDRRFRFRHDRVPPTPRKSSLDGLLIAVSNPMTILPYLGFATSAAYAATVEAQRSLMFSTGAALGALGWYALIVSLTLIASRRIGRRLGERLDMASGVILVGFGCLVLARGISWQG